jgi:hypothetical protein
MFVEGCPIESQALLVEVVVVEDDGVVEVDDEEEVFSIINKSMLLVANKVSIKWLSTLAKVVEGRNSTASSKVLDVVTEGEEETTGLLSVKEFVVELRC